MVGVIGFLIVYLKLFVVYGYWLLKYGIFGYYIFFYVEVDDLISVFGIMVKMGFVGCNVIILYKVWVLEFVDSIIDCVFLIGVVNMLIFGNDGKIYVDNIDGYGFLVFLK